MAEIPPATSASQLQTYAMCPRRYALNYVYGAEPEFRSKALVLGSAIHSSIAWWFTERIEGRVPAISSAEEIMTADLAAAVAGENVRWKDGTPEDLEEEGRRLLRTYLSVHGDLPVAQVEQKFEVDLADPETGEVLGRNLVGYFDLTLEDQSVIELKTSSRGWREVDLARHLQVGTYCVAWNSLHGGPSQIEVHVIVKLKREPRVESYRVERGEPATRWWLTAAGAIERAIAARHFPPTPGPLCTECEYDSACAAWLDGEPFVQPVRRLPVLHESGAVALGL